MPTKGSIYTLTDPRDGTIRYVGKTTKKLSERLAGHLASPTNPAMRLWINMLSAQRMIPMISLVSSAPEERLGAEEDRLIRKHIKQGHRLFNAPYYHQHLSDLTAPSAAPKKAAPVLPAGQPDPLRDFCRRQYEPIVRQRAAGRMSAKRAAGIVATRAILVSAYALWQLWVVRCAAAVAAVGWYLSTVGLGHLVEEQVLPRLPVAEAAAFWHEYLAGPVSTMAIHASVLLYVWSLASYGDLRQAITPRQAARRVPARPDPVDIAAAAALALDQAFEPGRP